MLAANIKASSAILGEYFFMSYFSAKHLFLALIQCCL